jgi:hypothetical protein
MGEPGRRADRKGEPEKEVEWAGRRTWGSDNRLLLSPDSGGGYAAAAAFTGEFTDAVLR